MPLGLREHLAIWLKADEGVDLDNDVECKSKGGSSCSVNRYATNPHLNYCHDVYIAVS